jgi:hypothetical protein
MREPLLGVAVGKKGVGKTFTTNKLIRQYAMGNYASGVLPRKVLILDANDEFTEYKAIALKDLMLFSVHPLVEVRRIRPIHPDGKKMTLDDLAATLNHIIEVFSGGLLLIEDINRFTSDHMPQDLMGAIATNRHRDLDIILHYQGIGRVGTKVWQNINWLRMHKITESAIRHQKKFEDKYELIRISELMVNAQYFNGNERFYQYVDCENMCMMGPVDETLFAEACKTYIEENYRRLISPLLQIRTGANKRKFTPDSAYKSEMERLNKMYLKKKN